MAAAAPNAAPSPQWAETAVESSLEHPVPSARVHANEMSKEEEPVASANAQPRRLAGAGESAVQAVLDLMRRQPEWGASLIANREKLDTLLQQVRDEGEDAAPILQALFGAPKPVHSSVMPATMTHRGRGISAQSEDVSSPGAGTESSQIIAVDDPADWLFTSHRCGIVGALHVAHRIVMAPMTRVRAAAETHVPTPEMVIYYAQRASLGGLIITEGTAISPEGTPQWLRYPPVRGRSAQVPGIWGADQVAGWRAVTDAVHAKGGFICCQLLHTGRVAQPNVVPSISSSSVRISATSHATVVEGREYDETYIDADESVTPRAVSAAEIARVLADFRQAAHNALDAGFDAIELQVSRGTYEEGQARGRQGTCMQARRAGEGRRARQWGHHVATGVSHTL